MPKIYKISAIANTPTVVELNRGVLTQDVDVATDMYVSVEGFTGIYQNLLQTSSIIKSDHYNITNFGIKTNKEYLDLVFTGDTFITGNTISEMPEYRGQHSMTLEQNIFNGRTNYAIIPIPTFTISSATRTLTGLTTGSTGVNIENGTGFTIPIQFTENQSSISAQSIDFNFNIYKYDSAVSGFSTTPVYMSEKFLHSYHSSDYTIAFDITKDSLNTDFFDGEYLVKGFYEYDSPHSISKKLGIRHSNHDIITGSSLNIYEPKRDWYMVILEGVQKPTFRNVAGATVDELAGSIKTVRETVGFNGQTAFTITDEYLGGVFVVVNGITLTNDLDYSISTSTATTATAEILFNVELLTTDILTFTYIENGSVENILVNEYQVAETIATGPTDGQGSNKVYYNSTTEKYEYYLDTIPGSNTFILMLNGAMLTQNIDFYLSSTNNKRIIFDAGSLISGDIISIYYEQGSGIANNITTNTPTMSWSLTNPSSTTASTFNIQMALYSDTTFSDIKFNQVINHTIGIKDYSNEIGPLSGLTYGDKVLCRVVNNKDFNTISGDTLSMVATSETITLKILSNVINTY